MLLKGVNNVNHFSLVEEGQKTSAAIDSTGGGLTVANLLGDTISLEIPPYAIWEPTSNINQLRYTQISSSIMIAKLE